MFDRFINTLLDYILFLKKLVLTQNSFFTQNFCLDLIAFLEKSHLSYPRFNCFFEKVTFVSSVKFLIYLIYCVFESAAIGINRLTVYFFLLDREISKTIWFFA